MRRDSNSLRSCRAGASTSQGRAYTEVTRAAPAAVSTAEIKQTERMSWTPRRIIDGFTDGDSNGIPVASKIKRRHVVSQNKSYFPSTRRPHAGSNDSECGATTVHGWVSAPRLHARRAPRRLRDHRAARCHSLAGPNTGPRTRAHSTMRQQHSADLSFGFDVHEREQRHPSAARTVARLVVNVGRPSWICTSLRGIRQTQLSGGVALALLRGEPRRVDGNIPVSIR